MQNTKLASNDRIAYEKLPWVALLAALAAAVANALVYFAASALGFIPQSILVPSRPCWVLEERRCVSSVLSTLILIAAK